MMNKLFLLFVIGLNSLGISAQTTAPDPSEYLVIDSDTIPQGKMEFELYFAEWGGRMGNAPCEVIIEGKNITVQQTSETNLKGEKIMTKGVLIRHRSGGWIIGNDPADANAEEIGGCSGGPIRIDFDQKVIEWC